MKSLRQAKGYGHSNTRKTVKAAYRAAERKGRKNVEDLNYRECDSEEMHILHISSKVNLGDGNSWQRALRTYY